VLYHAAIFLALVLCALVIDGVLHLAGQPDVGRWLGYLGTFLIVVSFVHSARRLEIISVGRYSIYLRIHEFLAWTGAVLVLVHGGIHFNAALPWIAMTAMLVAVASGLTGKYLLKHFRNNVRDKRRHLVDAGLSPKELEERLYFDRVVERLMRNWRRIHLPIATTFAFFALLHIVSVLAFWRWSP
jgi:cytochrome b561